MLRSGAIAIAALMSFAVAAPAAAAVIVNAADIGYNFTIDYTGKVGGQTTPSVSGLGTFTFTGLSNSNKTYNFNYSLLNDSTTGSRLSGFAFNTTPNPTAASVNGAFTNSYIQGNYPEGYSTTDFCFTDGGGSCSGGGNGGLIMNETGTGSFAITFASVMNSVTFDSFVTRFQSIQGVAAGTSGIGLGAVVPSTPPITAPEPGTWLMLLVGFGLVGSALRHRRVTQQVRQAI